MDKSLRLTFWATLYINHVSSILFCRQVDVDKTNYYFNSLAISVLLNFKVTNSQQIYSTAETLTCADAV